MNTSAPAEPGGQLRTRRATVGRGPTTYDPGTRSAWATLATEGPAQVFDPAFGRAVDEILLVRGAVIPAKVPLLDSHDRSRVAAVVGSVAEIQVEGDTLVGRLTFSQSASHLAKLVEEGHLTAVSVGYVVSKTQFVPSGRTESIQGRAYSGPVNVVVGWELKEVSLVAIGADRNARIRAACKTERVHGMTPNEVTSSNSATNLSASNVGPDTFVIGTPRDESEQTNRALINAAIRTACELMGRPDQAHGLISEQLATLDQARARLRDLQQHLAHERDGRLARLPFTVTDGSSRIDHAGSRDDKLRSAMADGLSVRALSACMTPEQVERHNPERQRRPGWQDFRHASLLKLATWSLEEAGINVRRLSDPQIAMQALGDHRQRAAFHFGGSFPSLLLDAVNKSLLAGYLEAPVSYRRAFKQGDSVPDFKRIYRVRLSETPNLPIWPDGQAPEETALVDERESFAVEARSRKVSFSWKLIINDDLAALSRVPAALGAAAARTENALAWTVLTSNPTLQDGVALFSAATGNRKRTNVGTTAAISVDSLSEARSIMRKQVGLNTKGGNASDAILNLEPRFLVVPASKETLADQVVNSTFDPTLLTNQTNLRANPFLKKLEVITEPLLDTASATAWFLLCSPEQATTVEFCHLQGFEQPQARSWIDDETLAHSYAVVSCFGAAAIDFRGAVKNAGA